MRAVIVETVTEKYRTPVQREMSYVVLAVDSGLALIDTGVKQEAFQGLNKGYSIHRVIHIPTGYVVAPQLKAGQFKEFVKLWKSFNWSITDNVFSAVSITKKGKGTSVGSVYETTITSLKRYTIETGTDDV